MPAKQNNGKPKLKGLTLLDLKETWFLLDGKRINVEDATDTEFDTYIRQYMTIGWSLEDRRDAVNLILQRQVDLGKTPEIEQVEFQGKTQYRLIFKGIESAPEEP